MIEKLIPLKLPPGLANNGTTYQSKGRWFLGSLVRFFQGNIQPIGGWVKRTLTGATISGIPNAAISWQTNDGVAWLAIGTTTHLYVVSAANVVSDITPSSGFVTAGNPAYWQLEIFGAYLVAVYNGTGTNPGGAVTAFVWQGDPSVVAAQVSDALTAPNSTFGVVVTPERFLFLLRGADPVTLGGNNLISFRASRAGAVSTLLVN